MAVYSFSTQDERNPKDKEHVDRLKVYCKKKKLSFSALVTETVVKLSKELTDGENS